MDSPRFSSDNGEETQVTANEALEYADSAIEKYHEALGEQAKLTNVLGLALIPLGAATLGLGISEAGGNTITALGLTGATALGMGTWLGNKPQQQVYLTGIAAIECAKTAMRPLLFSDNELKKFRNDLYLDEDEIESLRVKIDNVKSNIAKVERLISEASDGAEWKDAKAEIETAERVLEEAERTSGSGQKLDYELSRAGTTLVSAVNDIMVLVDRQTLANQSDLQSVGPIINGLLQSSAQFTTIPPTKAAPTAETPAQRKYTASLQSEPWASLTAGRKLELAVADLKESERELIDASGKVAYVVNQISEAKPTAGKLEDCGAKVEEAVASIQLQPPGEVKVKKGDALVHRIAVTGGKPLYQANFVGEKPSKGIALSNVIEDGIFFVVIKVDGGDLAPDPGTYPVLITDATQTRGKTINVVVEE